MKKSKSLLLIFAILSLTVCSCGNKSEGTKTESPNTLITLQDQDAPPPQEIKEPEQDKMMYKKESSTNKSPGSIKLVSNVPDVTNRMIIKTGTMNLETEKYDETINQINDYVKKTDGFITNSNSSVNASGKKQGSITIRIASNKYDTMVKDMENFGKVLNSVINGNDVTSEYIDLQARMITQTELEKRLLTLLNEKTARLVDVVEVEEKLSGVREVIEKTQGRMNYLKNQSDFSTLTISVYEPSLMVTSSGGGFFYEIGKGFSKGLKGFTEILAGMITFVIALMPVIILLVILGYITILIYRKSRARKITTA